MMDIKLDIMITEQNVHIQKIQMKSFIGLVDIVLHWMVIPEVLICN
jgi:hypothetical protein